MESRIPAGPQHPFRVQLCVSSRLRADSLRRSRPAWQVDWGVFNCAHGWRSTWEVSFSTSQQPNYVQISKEEAIPNQDVGQKWKIWKNEVLKFKSGKHYFVFKATRGLWCQLTGTQRGSLTIWSESIWLLHCESQQWDHMFVFNVFTPYGLRTGGITWQI